ncbi:hypothetical protein [Thalassoglobus polymorphus]|nr:hypothetical protein [Thalassoglobus polymorphus]
MNLPSHRSLLRPMLFTQRKRIRLFSLLATPAIAASIFAFVQFKHREANTQRAINRAAFYQRVVKEQAKVTGPPLAKVVAIDSGEPVEGTIIGMTLIGPDGGDGGFYCFVTQESGLAPLHRPLTPGRYQYHLEPDPDSRFDRTEWRRNQPYIIVASDGTTTVPTLQLEVAAGG